MLPASSTHPGVPGWRVAIALLGVIVGGAIVVGLRQRGVPVLDSMWAEDGSVYLEDALRDPLGAIVQPYAGYLHPLARLVALGAVIGPIGAAAAVMSGGAALLVGAVAAVVLVASGTLVRSMALRLALAAAIVLVPVARIESLANLANVHFYLIVAAAWAFLWRPRGWAGTAVSSVVVAAAALSDPLAIVLAPLAARAWLRGADARDRLPVVVGAVALAAHLLVILVSGIETTSGRATDPDPLAIAALYPIRVVVGLAGLEPLWVLWSAVGSVVLVIGVGLAVAGGVAIARRPDLPDRGAVALLVLASVTDFAIVLWVRWDAGFAPAPDTGFLRDGVRYLLVPVLLLLSALVIAMDRWLAVAPSRWRPLLLVGGIVLVALLWLPDVRGTNARSGAPTWADGLAAARERCATTDDGASVEVDIAPDGWSMRVPCSALGER